MDGKGPAVAEQQVGIGGTTKWRLASLVCHPSSSNNAELKQSLLRWQDLFQDFVSACYWDSLGPTDKGLLHALEPGLELLYHSSLDVHHFRSSHCNFSPYLAGRHGQKAGQLRLVCYLSDHCSVRGAKHRPDGLYTQRLVLFLSLG